jgi:ArsR family transcriptional regulator
MDDTTIAAIAKALAHPARLHILRLLAAQTECRGADVFAELPLAQSTISEHLRVLKDANLIHSRPLVGSNGTVYCLAPGVFEDFIAAVSGIASAAPVCSSSGGC